METSAAALSLSAPDWSTLPSPPGGDALWRWFLTPSGLYHSTEPDPTPPPSSVALGLSDLHIDSLSWEARHKTLSYLLRVQARGSAAPDEVVLLNERGEITGASMANLFWVTDGSILTPAPEAGCRRGVVRRWVLEHSERSVKEVHEPPASLDNADEIFLTNSRVGILPVHAWGGRNLDPGPVTRALQTGLRRFVFESK